MSSIASLPSVTSTGDGKYVGDEKPYVPSTDATWYVMPMRSPARKRAALTSAQSARPVFGVIEVRVRVDQRLGADRRMRSRAAGHSASASSSRSATSASLAPRSISRIASSS